MEFTPRKIKSVTNLVDFKNLIKNGSVLNACATYVLLKMKMQKIGLENLSLHTLGPILESKGMRGIFQKKGKKVLKKSKKRQNI